MLGAALARRAAQELEEDAGIPSTSVAALLDEARRRPYTALPRRAVLVVDEAGMVSTRQLAELVDLAERRRAKLVLVGDYRQLAEIEAGGAFRALASRLPAIELTENRRQVDRWERDALELLRDGDPRVALQQYEEHGRVVTEQSADEARRRVVADWWAERDPDRAVMIAFRRVDVADLNGRARALMRAAGALGEQELELAAGGFAVGDRVVLRRNDRRLGVANGERGVVAAVEPRGRTMDVELGDRRVRLDADYLDRDGRHGPALAHGYAITGHSAQGLTCDRTFVLVTSEASREWCYTALSRGRHENRLYAVAREPDDRAEFAPSDVRRDPVAAAFGRRSEQTLANDVVERANELQRVTRELELADREHHRAAVPARSSRSQRPAALRVGARARHQEALDAARTAEARAAKRAAELRTRVADLAERRPERQSRPRRERPLAEHVRDVGLER